MPIQTTLHVPVLIQPILKFATDLQPTTIFDGTLGGAGHTLALARILPANGTLLAADRDPAAVARFQSLLDTWATETTTSDEELAVAKSELRPTTSPNWSIHHASYHELAAILLEVGIPSVDMILLDLGLSSDQLADDERGFSFRATGPLDLRFDPTDGQPAWEILDQLPESELADVLYQYGDERFSRRIAARVVARRKDAPVRSAADFRELIHGCVPGSKHGRIDPATRSFQALRIFVNQELQRLAEALVELPKLLSVGGLLQIISFHSLEDRLVKNAFRDAENLEVVTRKPIVADEAEMALNSRSRSAKLRVARRIELPEGHQGRVRSLAEFQRHSHF